MLYTDGRLVFSSSPVNGLGEMSPFTWMSIVLFVTLGKSEKQYIRHERTRYMNAGNPFYASTFPDALSMNNTSVKNAFASRSIVQVLQNGAKAKKASRPLFSWDPPTNESSAAAPLNYGSSVSTIKPTIWHSPRKPKAFFKGVTASTVDSNYSASGSILRPHVKKDSIAFRNSYVYKAVPSEEEKPTMSKKIIHVVSRNSRRERKKGRRSHLRKSVSGGNQTRLDNWRTNCKDQRTCMRIKTNAPESRADASSKKKHLAAGSNEIVRLSDVRGLPDAEYLPKGPVRADVGFGVAAKPQNPKESENRWNVPSGVGMESTDKKDNSTKEKDEYLRKFADSRICSSRRVKCDQICTEHGGQSICSCYSGFVLINETRCIDINECQISNGGCDGTCINTVGSRRCLCPEGFRLSSVDGECEDVNECLLRNGHGPCQDTCINTRGNYYCSCEGLKGTVLAADNHSCEEVNDCNWDTAGCSHSCISTFGRAFCTCPDGYELGEDWKTCHDIDECADPEDHNVHCDSECVNTIGSYYCETKNILLASVLNS